jgi:hypothetical protein
VPGVEAGGGLGTSSIGLAVIDRIPSVIFGVSELDPPF